MDFICRQWEDIAELYSVSEENRSVFYTDMYFIMSTLWELYADWIICKKQEIVDLVGKVFSSPSWKDDEALDLRRGGQDGEERLAHV